MKALRLDRWASQLQPPRNPRLVLLTKQCSFSSGGTTSSQEAHREQEREQSCIRQQSQRRNFSASTRRRAVAFAEAEQDPSELQEDNGTTFEDAPDFPTHRHASDSAKLSALHARLSLPARFPLQTLARCLIDPSVDSRPGYNNAPMAILGSDLLGYHTSEYLITQYPRIPMPVLFAAQYAYVGPATLAAVRSEWGVETVAAPGPEVDPGLLQLKRTVAGNAMASDGMRRIRDLPQARRLGSGRNNQETYRRGMSGRIVYDDQFGDAQPNSLNGAPFPGAPISKAAETEASATEKTAVVASHEETSPETEPSTVEAASAGFVCALAGALYLHAGAQAVKQFHRDHILSRQLQMHTLFSFTYPTRDLSRLCAREGFEPPVARLLSETGRLSRSPVFIVGVFSGDDKLGEGAGSSLNEARVRAAAAALRSWYLYSPPASEIMLPSDVEGAASSIKPWKPQMIDIGEIVT